MDPQSVAVIVCVALALGLLGRELWRTWHPSEDGCGGCGCASRRTLAEEPEHSRLELPMQTTSPRDK